jgi:hypothetical protein
MDALAHRLPALAPCALQSMILEWSAYPPLLAHAHVLAPLAPPRRGGGVKRGARARMALPPYIYIIGGGKGGERLQALAQYNNRGGSP